MTRLPGGSLERGDRLRVRYIPLPISRTSGEHSEAFEMLVKNTVAPPPPNVHSVIPAFARRREAANGRVDIEHSGQVLRVYLERPWLVTGDGEQLAVVLSPASAPLPGLTAIGRDPVTPGAGPSLAPDSTDFPRAISTATAVDGRNDVAGHTVTYDAEQQRWFADVEVGPTGQYRPFVRLTVARYQPDTVAGAELSTFVTLEPVRLRVARTVNVERNGDTVDVTVSGLEHAGIPDRSVSNKPLLFNRVTVTVQEADPAITDADLRWRSISEPVALVRAPVAGTTTWSGAVALPASANPLRVVIEELEPAMQTTDGVLGVGESVVFVETVELK